MKRTLGDLIIDSANDIFELKRLEREKNLKEFKEYCPVCGSRLQPGERFCCDNCELIFYDERGEGC